MFRETSSLWSLSSAPRQDEMKCALLSKAHDNFIKIEIKFNKILVSLQSAAKGRC